MSQRKDLSLFHLERVKLQSTSSKRGSVEDYAFHLKRGYDGPGIKKVGMVANFAQLHQDVDDTHVMASSKSFSSPVNHFTR